MSVDGPRMRRCAVLGSPIAHSLSPALHSAAYAQLGLNWHYGLHDVDAAGLERFIDGLDSSWRGLSLTMPLKEAAIPCLHRISETARLVGAVNTVVIEQDGHRWGENTDVDGMVNALRERGVGRVRAATVLGGGATARSALAALRQVADAVTIYVRTSARADALLSTATQLGMPCTVQPWSARQEGLAAPVVLATTPVGATDDLADGLADLLPSPAGALLDVVYNAGATPLARAWAAAGGAVADGLDLLAHQAALQVLLMTGKDVPVSLLREAGERAMAVRAAARAQSSPAGD